ncbi:hypothetical protein WN944_008418 [Citrus x changshan-huyou]|uniref:tRNA pseudouridine synthase n=1 Tax=Citrus x changshan-huyou TaxID=2935761 RepID=A0AAP0MMW1_9ROSI
MSEAKQELISSLQSQVEALQNRVKELEADNAKLLSKLSLCRCEKIEDKVHDGVEDGTTLVEENRKTESGGCKTGKKKVKEKMSGTLNHHFKRYVALKVMYFGQRFYGFASDGNMEPTVESEIFKALEKTRLLVADKKESHYSRCGRTDKGVSSVGQVIAIYLRSNIKECNTNNASMGETVQEEQIEDEIDYVRVLNRVLPKDIRVIGWSPAPTDFSASFEGNQLCAIKIRGSAFLWHQVRCMVAVLFMIGQGLESIDVIESLLDTNGIPRKPQYNMAPEIPLVLQSCEFEGLKFTCSLDAGHDLRLHLRNECQVYQLQAAIFHEALLNCLPLANDQNSLRNGMVKKKASHIPLFSRPTERKFLHTLSTHVIMPILKAQQSKNSLDYKLEIEAQTVKLACELKFFTNDARLLDEICSKIFT